MQTVRGLGSGGEAEGEGQEEGAGANGEAPREPKSGESAREAGGENPVEETGEVQEVRQCQLKYVPVTDSVCPHCRSRFCTVWRLAESIRQQAQ